MKKTNISEPNLYWVNAEFTPKKGRPVLVKYINENRRNHRTFLIAIHNGDYWVFPDCLQKRRQKYVKQWAAIPED